MKKPYASSDKPDKGKNGWPPMSDAKKAVQNAKRGKKGVNPFAKVKK